MADYERFWKQKDLSDVVVVIYEEYADNREVQRDRLFPAHKVVLAANSEVLRAQVVKWAPATRGHDHTEAFTDVPQLRMEVPAGQLDVGEWLLKAMYQLKPDAAGMSQSVLLQLLVLADRYAVAKVITAVSKRLMQLTVADLEWNMVKAVYELPELFSGIDSYSYVICFAKQKLETDLGDLDLVWADTTGQRQQKLLGLPYQAIHDLLSSPRTKVMSENTMAHSIIKWSEHNKPEQQQLQELVALVRMAHCTPAYIATKISSSSWFTACLGPQELQFAAFCCSIGVEKARDIRSQGHNILSRYPAWAADKRPESAVQHIAFDHTVSLQDIKTLYNKLPQQASASASIRLGSITWQGFTFVVGLALAKKTVTGLIDGICTGADVYCLATCLGLEEDAGVVAAVTWTTEHPKPVPHWARAWQRSAPNTRLAPDAGSQHALPRSTAQRTCHLISTGEGGGALQTIFVKYGHPYNKCGGGAVGSSDWLALEARLREQLMSVDGRLGLKIQITSVS